MSSNKPIIGIVGAGKVGQVLAHSWADAGYEIGAIYNRTTDSAIELASIVNASVVHSPFEVVERCDVTLLSVPDDVIEQVAESITEVSNERIQGIKAVIHASGAKSLDILANLSQKGVMVGCLHPAFPFSDVEIAIKSIRGATFAIESSDEQLTDWLSGLVDALDGNVIHIPTGGKAQYHLALVLASNYTVTLYAIAEQLLTELGANRDVADQALNTLMSATLENLQKNGIPDALTGPLTRVDVGTLDSHLKAISAERPILQSVYIGLARLSYPMLTAREIDTELIEKFLRQGE